MSFQLHNLEQVTGFTAELDIDVVSGTGDTSLLTTDMTPASGVIVAGAHRDFVANFTGSAIGVYQATYTLQVSDEDLPGSIYGTPLVLTLKGKRVVKADLDQDTDVDIDDIGLINACRTGPQIPYNPQNLAPACTLIPVNNLLPADLDGDGDVDQDDFGALQRCYSGLGVAAQAGCDTN